MEKDLQKKCVDYANSLKMFIYSNNPPHFKRLTYGTKYGIPDLTVVYNGIVSYFELKDRQYKSAHKERQQKQLKIRKELWKHKVRAYKVDTFEKFKIILGFIYGKVI